jgi:protein MAK16
VLENKGQLYLCIKTVERQYTPNKLWEKTKLSNNYDEALKTIEEKLQFSNPFQVHKCKQRLTKLTEMIGRIRKLKLKEKEKVHLVQKKAERRDAQRLKKAESIASVNTNIEKELLD